MKKKPPITRKELQRIRDFLHSYNVIDHELRRRLQEGKKTAFGDLVNALEKEGGRRGDIECLRRAASLRNFVVHEPKRDDDISAIPTDGMVLKLVSVAQRLTDHQKIVPRFAKKVEVVSANDSLAHVLRQIDNREFSQFPVYSEGKFKGLLTETGITRWLAGHVTRTLTLIELDEVFVSQLLRAEESTKPYEFLPADTETDIAREIFRGHDLLEAILITEDGTRHRPLKGIITRWDMIHS